MGRRGSQGPTQQQNENEIGNLKSISPSWDILKQIFGRSLSSTLHQGYRRESSGQIGEYNLFGESSIFHLFYPGSVFGSVLYK